MTYQEIVDRFKQVVEDHNQLQDFGYGNLSDIKTRSEGGTTTNADYPYLFLNQGVHTRNGQSITYNFNMIVMDMVKDDNFLKIQSECQQYIDDVLARLRFHYTDQVDLNLSNITLTPFKERFQDTVAGMTASVSIQIPLRLSECIAPYTPIPEPPVDCELVVDGYSIKPQRFEPDTQQSPVEVQDIVLNDGGWRPPQDGGNFYVPQTLDPITWRIIGSITMVRVDEGDIFNPFWIEDTSNGSLIVPTQVIGWPSTPPAVGETFNFELVYENIQPNNTSSFLAALPKDVPGTQADFDLLTGTNIKICIAPYTPIPEQGTLIYDADYFPEGIDWTGTPLQLQTPIVYDESILSYQTDGVNIRVLETGTYRFEFDAVLQNTITQAQYDALLAECPTECFQNPPLRWHLMEGIFFPNTPTEVTGFVWTYDSQTGVDIPTRYEFEVELTQNVAYQWIYNTTSAPNSYTGDYLNVVSGNLKIYKIG